MWLVKVVELTNVDVERGTMNEDWLCFRQYEQQKVPSRAVLPL